MEVVQTILGVIGNIILIGIGIIGTLLAIGYAAAFWTKGSKDCLQNQLC